MTSPTQKTASQTWQQSSFVEEAKQMLQMIKDAVMRVWNTALIGIHATGGKIGFVFFRVLEWFHPILGPRFEILTLRLGYVWKAVQDAWTQESIQKSVVTLKEENIELLDRVKKLSRDAREKNQLQRECTYLRRENAQLRRDCQNLEQRLNGERAHEEHVVAREQAVVVDRDILEQRAGGLEGRNQQLSQELQTQSDLYQRAKQLCVTLARKLQAADQRMKDLQEKQNVEEEVNQHFEQVATILLQLKQQPLDEAQRGKLDDQIEKGIPLCLQLIGGMKEQYLQTIKESMKENSSGFFAVEGLSQMIDQLEEKIQEILPLLEMHKNFQNPVNQLLQEREGEVWPV